MYTSIFGPLGCTFFIQETFLFIHTQMYTCIYTHGLIIAMHTLHMKVSLRLLPKSHKKIIPIDSCAVFSSFYHVFVHFVYYFMQSKIPHFLFLYLNSLFPLSRKSAAICRQSVITVISHMFPKSTCCLLLGAI